MATGVCSIVLGGAFGVLATVGMGAGSMADIALMFGAIAGLLCSPALIFGLWHGSMFWGLVWIALPTSIAAYVGGMLTPPNAGPTPSMVIAISVYVLASLVRGVVGVVYLRPPPAGACARCAYDLRGLAPDLVCPECGAARSMNAEA